VAFSSVEGTGKLAVGAVGPKPYVVEMKQPSQDAIGEALKSVLKQIRAVGNTVLDPDYRKRMIPVLAGKLINKVMEGAK
jgi:4-hydroxybenzoyl-CoA reductase subunit beta